MHQTLEPQITTGDGDELETLDTPYDGLQCQLIILMLDICKNN